MAAAQTASDTAETSIVTGTPTVVTQASSAMAAPGTAISDQAVVSGLGALSATVNVQLWGPYASTDAIDCTGTPAWTGSFTANGDGTYTTAKAALPAAGYYTYQESIAATPAYPAVTTACAGTSETAFAHGTPNVATIASSAAIRPGATIHDHLTVTGLGHTPATIVVDLFGPYASIAAVNCAGRPVSQTALKVPGNGSYNSTGVKVPRVGFYVFRERIAPSPLIAGVNTACSLTPETSLGIPAIITGPGERISADRPPPPPGRRPGVCRAASRSRASASPHRFSPRRST